MSKRNSSRRQPIVIDVPDVPAEEAGPQDAESRAVASHPKFQEVITEGREAFARGEGVDADEVFRELGLEDDGSSGAGNGPESPRANGAATHRCEPVPPT